MSLRFVLGPAGSGKTRLCLDEICDELVGEALDGGPPLYLLVPEQATFQMERALLTFRPEVRATARARVLSFKRLAHLALDAGGSLPGRSLGELGKLLALQVIVARRREALALFREASASEGFVEAIAALLSELRTYRHAPEGLRAAASVFGDDPLLSRKLEEVATLFEEYREFLGRGFFDVDSLFESACRALRGAPLLRGARVWMDGFAGLTPQEYELLRPVLATASQVTVALCVDPTLLPAEPWSEGPPDGLFHPVLETLVQLRKVAEEEGVPLEPPLLLDPGASGARRFRGAPLLGRLERLMVRDPSALYGSIALPGKRVASGGAPPIRVVEAPDRKSEVEEAARQIVRWVRDEGRSFGEIAVILRELEPYRELIETTFSAWEIPFFLDCKEPAHHHPAASLLRGALEVAVGDFSTDGVVRYLKSGFAPVGDDAADRLENAALRRGVDGREWEKEHHFEEDEELLEAWRKALAPLCSLRDRWQRLFASGRAPANAVVALVQGFFDELGAAATVEAWVDEALAAGDPLEAQEHAQAWNALAELLEEIAAVMGESLLSPEEFDQAVTLGLKRLRLGRVPPRIDQVLVGSIERSRQPDLACAIILGCNAGIFPAEQGEEAIFSDAEREALLAAGLRLSPGSRLRSHHERYLVYIALTRASRSLLLTFSRSDERGRPLKPSAFIDWLCSRIEGLEVERLAAGRPYERFPESREGIARWLAGTLRAMREGARLSEERLVEALSVEVWLRSKPELAERESRLPLDPMAALEYRNWSAPLSRAEVDALYGREILLSPTALEDFASCPFRFFAAHGLRLEERERRRLAPSDLGLLSHAVLRRLVERLQAAGIDWAELDREGSDRLVEAAFDEVVEGEAGEPFKASATGRYVLRRMRRMLKAVAWAIGGHARRGEFRPFAVEVSFGPGRRLPALELEVGEERRAFLQGRIDRIDHATNEEGGRFLRVVDYKSSRRPFRLDALVYGIDIQLGVYAAVVLRSFAREAELAGCLYFPVFDPVVSRDHPGEEGEEAWFKPLRAAGLIVDAWGVPRLMDREAVGASPLLPLEFNRDGALGKRSWTATPERAGKLVEYVERAAAALAGRIASGETEIAPYTLADETPCRTCTFKPVCQFDPLIEGNGYRPLRPLEKDEAWSEIERRLGEGEFDLAI